MATKSLNILIVGDSFAAEWPNANNGWVNLLAEKFNVTNLAQPGISEYKILQQIKSVNVRDFDYVIVSHTSPSRIHTPQHPIHKEGFHKHCDLIVADIDNRFSLFNDSLRAAQGWFKHHYDDKYQLDIYNLIRKEINSLITVPYISMTHVEIAANLAIEKTNLDFSKLWEKNRGSINHYTEFGNELVLMELLKWIK